MNGGLRANSSGRAAEDVLYAVLHNKGFTVERQAVVGQTIYGGELRVDFLIRNVAQFSAPLIVESKWQDVGGSADEKFPYLVSNLLIAPYPSVVVVHGGGQRDGAIDWLKAQADGTHIVAVFALEEFISWVMRSINPTR